MKIQRLRTKGQEGKGQTVIKEERRYKKEGILIII
jgi:hypothetical protein